MLLITTLRIILQSKKVYIIIFIIALSYSYAYVKYKENNFNEQYIVGVVYGINENSVYVRSNRNFILYTGDSYKFSYGDIIYFENNKVDIRKNSNFNLFCYKNYLKTKKIFNAVRTDNIIKIGYDNKYFIKNKMYKRANNFKNEDFIKTFVLGKNISNNTYNKMGISHLFSISGMHISLFALILFHLTNKFIKRSFASFLIVSFFLIIYSLLLMKLSVIRSVLLLILVYFKKTFKINIDNVFILIFIASILLINNPYLLFSVSFYYSFITTFFIVLYCSNNFTKKYYTYNLIKVSLVATLASFPITIYFFFEYNVLSYLYNLVFIPFVSFLLYPAAIISFIIKNEFILSFLISTFNNLVDFLNNENYILIFGRPNLFLVFMYYCLLFFYCINKKFKTLILVITIVFIMKNTNYFKNYARLYMYDIGFSESILFVMPKANQVLLFDTGGHFYDNEYNLSNHIIIPFIKSLGISKIDFLIISHGHIDHAKEAPNIISNFNVSTVFLNSGVNNYLEEKIIKTAKENNVYYKNISKYNLKINNYNFNFINEVHKDENEDSLVCYITFDDKSVLLTGDIYKKQEEKIIDNYNINNIDVLKVAHHGSMTSSSKTFLKKVNSKANLISSSKNNLYNLPNEEILKKLNNYYITSEKGMILVKFKEKIEIVTFY